MSPRLAYVLPLIISLHTFRCRSYQLRLKMLHLRLLAPVLIHLPRTQLPWLLMRQCRMLNRPCPLCGERWPTTWTASAVAKSSHSSTSKLDSCTSRARPRTCSTRHTLVCRRFEPRPSCRIRRRTSPRTLACTMMAQKHGVRTRPTPGGSSTVHETYIRHWTFHSCQPRIQAQSRSQGTTAVLSSMTAHDCGCLCRMLRAMQTRSRAGGGNGSPQPRILLLRVSHPSLRWGIHWTDRGRITRGTCICRAWSVPALRCLSSDSCRSRLGVKGRALELVSCSVLRCSFFPMYH